MKHEFRWALRSWLGDTVGWPMPNGLVAVLQVRYSTDDGGWSEWADVPSAVVLS